MLTSKATCQREPNSSTVCAIIVTIYRAWSTILTPGDWTRKTKNDSYYDENESDSEQRQRRQDKYIDVAGERAIFAGTSLQRGTTDTMQCSRPTKPVECRNHQATQARRRVKAKSFGKVLFVWNSNSSMYEVGCAILKRHDFNWLFNFLNVWCETHCWWYPDTIH